MKTVEPLPRAFGAGPESAIAHIIYSSSIANLEWKTGFWLRISCQNFVDKLSSKL